MFPNRDNTTTWRRFPNEALAYEAYLAERNGFRPNLFGPNSAEELAMHASRDGYGYWPSAYGPTHGPSMPYGYPTAFGYGPAFPYGFGPTGYGPTYGANPYTHAMGYGSAYGAAFLHGYGHPHATGAFPGVDARATPISPGMITRGPRNYRRSDERIREEICDRLSMLWLDTSDVEVTVRDGDVSLMGTIANRHEKRIVEEVADLVPGVRELHNDLRIAPNLEGRDPRRAATA